MTKGKPSATSHVLIGAGRMGGALLNGWIHGRGAAKLDARNILIIDPMPGEAANKALDLGAKFSTHLTKGSASGLKVCLLAIKPQLFEKIGPDLAKILPKEILVISIMAGINLAQLKDVFGKRSLVRAMPNTPAAYGKGITAFVCGSEVSKSQLKMANLCLRAGGKVVRVENERQIDMVTAVSGSGPAYVFYLTEALEAAGVKVGLPENLARELARQTVIGSGYMLDKSDEETASLRRAVTSPGGTTQAALEVLMAEDGLHLVLRKAVHAAYMRSRELGKKTYL